MSTTPPASSRLAVLLGWIGPLALAGALGWVLATQRLEARYAVASLTAASESAATQRRWTASFDSLQRDAAALVAVVRVQADSMDDAVARYQRLRAATNAATPANPLSEPAAPVSGDPVPALVASCDAVVSACQRYRVDTDSLLAAKDRVITALTLRGREDSIALARCQMARVAEVARYDASRQAGRTRRTWTTAGAALSGVVLGSWVVGNACR